MANPYVKTLTADQRDRVARFQTTIKNIHTMDSYGRDVAGFLGYCENTAGVTVSEANAGRLALVISEYTAIMAKAGMSGRSTARAMSAIKAYLNYCNLGLVAQDIKRPTVFAEESVRAAVTAPELVGRILSSKSLTVRQRALVTLFAFSPLNATEVLGLREDDIKEGLFCKLRGPYIEECREVCEALIKENVESRRKRRVNPPVFSTPTGLQISRQSAWKDVKAAARAAGLDRVTISSLGASYVVRLVEATQGNVLQASAMGDVSYEATLRVAKRLRKDVKRYAGK